MDDRRPLIEQLERAWSHALLAVSSAEDEAGKLLHRWGEAVGAQQEEAKRFVREFADRLTVQRQELERAVEERVRGAAARVRLPKREELQALDARMEKLSHRIQALREARR